MVETLCDSDDVKDKAGTFVSTSLSSGQYTRFINRAEGTINAEMRINFNDLFSGLNVDVKGILEDACSSLAAMEAINWDKSGFGLSDAQTALDFNYGRYKDAMRLLKEKPTTDFIEAA
jgi:hypothetical protein